MLPGEAASAAAAAQHYVVKDSNVLRHVFGSLSVYRKREPTITHAPKAEQPVIAKKDTSVAEYVRTRFEDIPGLWFRCAEEYVAIWVVDYIELILEHLRNYAMFLLAAVLLGASLLVSYPLYPRSLLYLYFLLASLGAIAAFLVIMGGISRNAVLSRINGTPRAR